MATETTGRTVVVVEEDDVGVAVVVDESAGGSVVVEVAVATAGATVEDVVGVVEAGSPPHEVSTTKMALPSIIDRRMRSPSGTPAAPAFIE